VIFRDELSNQPCFGVLFGVDSSDKYSTHIEIHAMESHTTCISLLYSFFETKKFKGVRTASTSISQDTTVMSVTSWGRIMNDEVLIVDIFTGLYENTSGPLSYRRLRRGANHIFQHRTGTNTLMVAHSFLVFGSISSMVLARGSVSSMEITAISIGWTIVFWLVDFRLNGAPQNMLPMFYQFALLAFVIIRHFRLVLQEYSA
jgi:hypothetical protein